MSTHDVEEPLEAPHPAAGGLSVSVSGTYGVENPLRTLSLLSGLVLTGSYVGVLFHITDVVGGSLALLGVTLAALVVSTLLARYLTNRQAVAVGVVLLVGGYAGYLLAVPFGWKILYHADRVVGDTVALLTGLSVLQMTKAGVWAISFVPAPVFVSWYLVIRGRYALGAGVGAAALSFFVLTGDANQYLALAGALGATGLIGFGEIHRRAGNLAQIDTLVVLLALMVVLASTLSIVPGGQASPLAPDRGPTTVEGGLLSTSDRIGAFGSIRLSPEVRWVVESDAPAYWKVSAYDRYTGNSWVKSGEPKDYPGALSGPPYKTRTVRQTFTAKTTINTMPAAWKPTRVQGEATDNARVDAQGALVPKNPWDPEDSYSVVSEVPQVTSEELRTAGSDYPDEIEENYLQLPESTPDRVAERTSQITQGADNPYEQAVAVETWLEDNKRYSLDVNAPRGNVADSFLFEMDAGYCTYFATSMVVMLRTQGVPARMVVGYTPGQRVAEDTWVVRGLDSHAWVEVYFPGEGWIRFDPTPSGPRDFAESDAVEEAREEGVEGVDAAGSEDGEWTPTPGPNGTAGSNVDPSDAIGGQFTAVIPDLNGTATGPEVGNVTPVRETSIAPSNEGNDGGSGGPIPDQLPRRETIGFGVVVLVGIVAGARRTGAAERAYRAAWVRIHRRHGDPTADVELAYRRLEYLLGRSYRTRRPGETERHYLESLAKVGMDDRAHDVYEIYERARYGDDVDTADADEAVGIVNSLAYARTPILGRLLN